MISGIGRTIDLWGCFGDFNDSPTEEIADQRGLYSDWSMVGKDLAEAIEREGSRLNAGER